MESTASRIRVGLLVDSLELCAWEIRMLEKIQQSNYADIDLVVINKASHPKKTIRSRLKNLASHGLYSIYDRLERRLFHPQPDAFATDDATPLLQHADILHVLPIMKKFSDTFPAQDVEKIKSYRLDVIIRLGFRILRGTILQAATCGVWSYHHGDNQVNRGGPAGFWEVLLGHPITGSVLQILTEDLDGGLVLYRSYSATEEVSVRRNRNNFYWKTLSFIPRKLEELHALGREDFLARAERKHEPLNFYSHRLYVTPSNREFLALATRHVLRRLRVRLSKLFFRDQWFLLIDVRKQMSTSLWRFRRLIPPRDRFWADPCVVEKDGETHLFIEEFVYKKNRGHISVMSVDSKGRPSVPRRVLEMPYHVSYPFVFQWKDNHYMIPEMANQRRIEVFQCARFPYQWVPHAVLMQDVEAVDTTLFEFGERWWLFTNLVENVGSSASDELFLFHARDPLSTEWTPHPLNPIVSDVRRSRPAGRLFTHQGRIIRPSQDSSGSYGFGIRMNEISVLNPTQYEEREIAVVQPLWDKRIRGIHTFSHAGNVTVADARHRRMKWFG